MSVIEDIDAVLPQTQCQLCGYPGCRPYAEAIAKKNDRFDRCPPGGVKTLRAIAKILNQDPTPYIYDMEKKVKSSSVAVIREGECIGCTKCIQACPVDAIIGASKLMHTVLTDMCTGCELCIAPCPVDCIDMIITPEHKDAEKITMAQQSRERYQKRNARLANEKLKHHQQHLKAKLLESHQETREARKAVINAAIARVKKKKSTVIKNV